MILSPRFPLLSQTRLCYPAHFFLERRAFSCHAKESASHERRSFSTPGFLRNFLSGWVTSLCQRVTDGGGVARCCPGYVAWTFFVRLRNPEIVRTTVIAERSKAFLPFHRLLPFKAFQSKRYLPLPLYFSLSLCLGTDPWGLQADNLNLGCGAVRASFGCKKKVKHGVRSGAQQQRAWKVGYGWSHLRSRTHG